MTRSPVASTKPAAAMPTPSTGGSVGDLVDGRGQGVLDEGGVDPSTGRGASRGADDLAGTGDGGGEHLRAPDVDADEE